MTATSMEQPDQETLYTTFHNWHIVLGAKTHNFHSTLYDVPPTYVRCLVMTEDLVSTVFLDQPLSAACAWLLSLEPECAASLRRSAGLRLQLSVLYECNTHFTIRY